MHSAILGGYNQVYWVFLEISLRAFLWQQILYQYHLDTWYEIISFVDIFIFSTCNCSINVINGKILFFLSLVKCNKYNQIFFPENSQLLFETFLLNTCVRHFIELINLKNTTKQEKSQAITMLGIHHRAYMQVVQRCQKPFPRIELIELSTENELRTHTSATHENHLTRILQLSAVRRSAFPPYTQ